MAVAIFNLSIRDLCGSIKRSWWTETYLRHIKLVYFVYWTTSVPKIRHQITWKVNPDSPAKHACPNAPSPWCYLSCFTSSRRDQGQCYVTSADGVMLRTGYVNSTVRTFAMLFSVATVVQPRIIPLDLYIISLFMWDFLKFREVIGLCKLSSLGNKTCTNQVRLTTLQ
jgi:hypothetical protein